MLDEGNNLNLEAPEAPPPEESNNRTFLIVGGVFAALIFLTLVCGAILVFWYLPSHNAQAQAAARATETANAQVVVQMTATAQVALYTATLPPTPLPSKTNTPSPAPKASNTPTPLLAGATNVIATVTPTTNPATLIAMQTQLSQQMTSTVAATKGLSAPAGTTPGTPGTPGTPTRVIPKTGLFDQVGLPSLVILTLALIAVIFLSRRLRSAPTR